MAPKIRNSEQLTAISHQLRPRNVERRAVWADGWWL